MDNSYNRYQPKDYVDSQSDGKPSPALIQSGSADDNHTDDNDYA